MSASPAAVPRATRSSPVRARAPPACTPWTTCGLLKQLREQEVSTVKRTIATCLCVVLATLAGGAAARAEANTETTNLQIPITLVAFVPCANGGAGELVELTGT